MKKLLLYTDGGSRSNPGPAAMGMVLMNEAEKVLAQKGQFLGERTNNEAEYLALIWGMTEALAYSPEELVCHLDSELVVNQLNGFYRIRKPHLQPLARQAKALEKQLGEVSYVYVPREENALADSLVNEALDKCTP